jgi:hypothetical protein
VGVRSTDVRSARDDGTGVAKTFLVGDIVDGKGILVVAVANVATIVLLVGATVDNALSIVCVAILTSAALDVGLGGVFHVDEHGSAMTGIVATGSTTSTVGDSVSELLIGNDSVRSAFDTLVDVDKSNVFLDIKSLGVLGRKLEELLQVEDLDVMSHTLRADNEAVADDFNLAPDDRVVVGWKTTQILKFALLINLRE